MRNKNIVSKITQGMYILTTDGGGCVVDAVSQISASEPPLIAVSVMKKNYTHELLKKNSRFAISVLGMNVNPEIIKTFGFHSMRDINKFDGINIMEIEGVSVICDSLGYMVCDIVDSIPNDTHTLFIGRLIEADVFSDEKAMSYQYYQENKEGLLKVTTSNGKTMWICSVCGYVYYGDELPDDFKCPICGVGREMFQKSKS